MTTDQDRWNARWKVRGLASSGSSSLLELVGPWLPAAGSALDVAGGGSGDAVALAVAGLPVTVADVSDAGLALNHKRAAQSGVAITTVQVDLENDALPPGPWAVITLANFSHGPLFGCLASALAPGGILAVVIATTTNLDRHAKPPLSFLLESEEILGLVGNLEVLHHSESWRVNGRHEAWLVARRSVYS